jgi:hypothetical protein
VQSRFSGFNFLDSAMYFHKLCLAVERFFIQSYLKRQFFVSDDYPGEHIDRRICVHANGFTKMVELVLNVGIHTDAESSCTGHAATSLNEPIVTQ